MKGVKGVPVEDTGHSLGKKARQKDQLGGSIGYR